MTKDKDSNSAKSKAYENLRYRIITQDLPPGELLKEKELMAHYRIGRTPLREILIELQRQGLIRRIPRSGTWVAPLDMAFVREIAEVRVPLERLAGQMAARRISAEELEGLEGILEKAQSRADSLDADLQQLMEYEARFHHHIYAAARNKKLEELLLEFQSISARLWHNVFYTREHLQKMFADQRRILDALKRGDSEECGELLVRHTQAYFGNINGMKAL